MLQATLLASTAMELIRDLKPGATVDALMLLREKTVRTARTGNAYFDLLQALKNTDIRFSYDFSDSDNAFVHSGPRIQAMASNVILTPGDSRPCSTGLTSCFEALPNVTNSWHRVTTDVKYFFTAKVGVGLAWYYEKFDASDFATIDLPGDPGTPRIDYLGEIATGYGVRPYKGNTATVRLLYKF